MKNIFLNRPSAPLSLFDTMAFIKDQSAADLDLPEKHHEDFKKLLVS